MRSLILLIALCSVAFPDVIFRRARPSASVTEFVTGATLGRQRSDHTGFVGFRITVGASDITAVSIGRYCNSGNSATHDVVIYHVEGAASVATGSVSMSGCTAGTYVYATISDTTLEAGDSYYIASKEVGSGDSWYDYDTVITHTSVATVPSSVFSDSDGVNWTTYGPTDSAFVPTNFRYK